MKLRSSFFTSSIALAAAALALAVPVAHAEYYAATDGDIYLGVYDSGGTVTGQYIVDLGSYTQFIGGTSQAFSLNIYNDLSDIYGSNWQTNTDLKFAVYGGLTDSDNGSGATFTARSTTFATQPGGDLGLVTLRNPNSGASVTFRSGYYGFQVISETVEGSQAIFVPANDPQTYFTGVLSTGVSWTLTNASTTKNIATSIIGTLDLYEVLPKGTGAGQAAQGTASAKLGSFAFDTYGDLAFTTATSPVPEPATYALFFGGAVGALVLWRKRRQ